MLYFHFLRESPNSEISLTGLDHWLWKDYLLMKSPQLIAQITAIKEGLEAPYLQILDFNFTLTKRRTRECSARSFYNSQSLKIFSPTRDISLFLVIRLTLVKAWFLGSEDKTFSFESATYLLTRPWTSLLTPLSWSLSFENKDHLTALLNYMIIINNECTYGLKVLCKLPRTPCPLGIHFWWRWLKLLWQHSGL